MAKGDYNRGVIAIVFFLLMVGLISSMPQFFSDIVVVFVILIAIGLLTAFKRR